MAYNVLGQLKLSLTLLGGYLLFDDPLKPVQLVGVIMTVVGCMLYTHNKVSKTIDFLVKKHKTDVQCLYFESPELIMSGVFKGLLYNAKKLRNITWKIEKT